MSAIRSLMRSVLPDKGRPNFVVTPEDDYLAEYFTTLEADFYWFVRRPLDCKSFFLLNGNEIPISLAVDCAITFSEPKIKDFARFWHIPCVQLVGRRDLKSIFGDLIIYYSMELMEHYQVPGLVIPPHIDEGFLYSGHSHEEKQPIILVDLENPYQVEIAKSLINQTRFRVQGINKLDKMKRLEQYRNSLCFVSLGNTKYSSYGLEAAAFGLPVICTNDDLEMVKYASFVSKDLNEIRLFISNIKGGNAKKEVENSPKDELLNTIMAYAENYVRIN